MVHSRSDTTGESASWVSPNGDLSSTRSAAASTITAESVGRLHVAWRYRVRGKGGGFGLLSSTPLMRDGIAYVQDTASSVYAIDLDTGRKRWARLKQEPNDGPNGLALVGDTLYGATDTSVFALAASDGRELWSTRLVSRTEQFVNIAPVVDRGRVYVSTVGFPPGGRGAIYALDAATGKQRWKFDTIKEPWRHREAGGGGAWQPLSVDRGRACLRGHRQPGTLGRVAAVPERRLVPRADALHRLARRARRCHWGPPLVRPGAPARRPRLRLPALADPRHRSDGRDLVIGGGKGGRIFAWDRVTHERIWTQAVGTHRNDIGPLPKRPVEVCPGLFGGALTPMAYADGRVFVPVVELCMLESAVKTASVLQRPPEDGTGVVAALDAATGRPSWTRKLPSAPMGARRWRPTSSSCRPSTGGSTRSSTDGGDPLERPREAGINGCPSVAGDTLLVPAGAPHRAFAKPVPQLIAYRLSASK